ncbi:MAG: excinuclease ABC subunit UvrA, partial [Thermoleophilia bacterium]|nr:excinuclease ABC subunit UvrA [Thermoleophilia bacterium]
AKRYIMRTLAESKSAPQRARALRYVETVNCEVCGGARLRPDALAVTFAGSNIAELAALPMRDLAVVLRPAAGHHTDGSEHDGGTSEAAALLASDLVARLDSLIALGLGYLSTDRETPTLSAGELQRLRLATQLRSGLFGVVYVLDEPSAGLHPADAEPLLDVLDQLKVSGNSLFVVEHDMDIVHRADWIVDVGPGAGVHGGQVLYSGPVAGLANIDESITRRFVFPEQIGPTLSELPMSLPMRRKESSAPPTQRVPTGQIELRNITRHNLHGLDVDVPRGVFTAVTGVSGSGKSTLVTQVLAELAAAGDITGVDRLVSVDQSPIGRTPRSNLATYTGLFDAVRKVFAATDMARERGYNAGRFSFNVTGGRCDTCQGEGFVAIELLFMPGTYAPCPTCDGARYEPATLEVTWHGKNIAEVLNMTVDAAAEFFAEIKAAARSLATLRDVGLGYLRLGQPATELSGGEAQRIKLASELQRSVRGHALYLLDEPTTGLHPADTELLMRQLHCIVDKGNTVVVVEHDMHVVAGADWVIDLGPGAGDEGGTIVATGTPAQVAQATESRTAPYLARCIR